MVTSLNKYCKIKIVGGDYKSYNNFSFESFNIIKLFYLIINDVIINDVYKQYVVFYNLLYRLSLGIKFKALYMYLVNAFYDVSINCIHFSK